MLVSSQLVYFLGMEQIKKLHITTFGCQMNEYDSEQIARMLSPLGYVLTPDISGADLILLNTCSIREKAEQKVFSHLGRLKRLKERSPNLIIGVGGCVAQQHGAKLLERVGHLDFVFGTQTLHQLPQMITEIKATGKRINSTAFQDDFVCPAAQEPAVPHHVKALLTIMRGCNNFCTFCIVPYVRGREVSRPKDEIMAEAEALIASGVREITLLGQNVNSYRSHDGYNFLSLLRDINKLEGLDRIRFTTSHPKDFSSELISAFGELEKLCSHMHLPVQSGSNPVLKKMSRRYTREEYIEKVEQLRSVCPEISITTDIIVGFPGETERDFQLTLDLMRRVRFASAFSFKYSDRPGARATTFTPKVPETIKSERLMELQTLQDEISLMQNKNLEGTVELVLVEGHAKRTPRKLTGRTSGNHVVNFIGSDDMIGRMIPIRLEKSFIHSISGTPCAAA